MRVVIGDHGGAPGQEVRRQESGGRRQEAGGRRSRGTTNTHHGVTESTGTHGWYGAFCRVPREARHSADGNHVAHPVPAATHLGRSFRETPWSPCLRRVCSPWSPGMPTGPPPAPLAQGRRRGRRMPVMRGLFVCVGKFDQRWLAPGPAEKCNPNRERSSCVAHGHIDGRPPCRG
jgi:hypothetical protein